MIALVGLHVATTACAAQTPSAPAFRTGKAQTAPSAPARLLWHGQILLTVQTRRTIMLSVETKGSATVSQANAIALPDLKVKGALA